MAPGGAAAQGVDADCAALLCALQLQGEYGQDLADEPAALVECVRTCGATTLCSEPAS